MHQKKWRVCIQTVHVFHRAHCFLCHHFTAQAIVGPKDIDSDVLFYWNLKWRRLAVWKHPNQRYCIWKSLWLSQYNCIFEHRKQISFNLRCDVPFTKKFIEETSFNDWDPAFDATTVREEKIFLNTVPDGSQESSSNTENTLLAVGMLYDWCIFSYR